MLTDRALLIELMMHLIDRSSSSHFPAPFTALGFLAIEVNSGQINCHLQLLFKVTSHSCHFSISIRFRVAYSFVPSSTVLRERTGRRWNTR